MHFAGTHAVFVLFLFPCKQRAQQVFEMQKSVTGLTETEARELAVHTRRAEGTPCTLDNFKAWKVAFEAEMAEKAKEEKENAELYSSKQKGKTEKKVDKSARKTGAAYFNDMTGILNMEDIEAAADNAESDDEEDDELPEDVDEELFDVGDDDLDDLDFDDDDEDDEEEYPDI
jgi:hypothetical protein